jgi:hypothetical protein
MIGGSIMESSYSLNLVHMQTMVMMDIMEMMGIMVMMASNLWKKVMHENASLEEEDGYEDDRMPDLLKDLYDAKDPVDEGKSMFAEVLEDAKRAVHDGGKFSRFTFTVKLLYVKSYYRISNAAFNAILNILTWVNSANVLDEGLWIGGRGRRMNSKSKGQSNKA